MLREKSGPCIAAAVLVALLLSGCGGDSADRRGASAPSAAAQERDRPLPVELVTVQRGTVTAGWQGTGTLEARDDARVAARVGGEIAQVMVDVGDRVAAGDALARLDTERLRLEADRAEALYRQRRAEAERSERLLARNMVSEDAHERAVADMRTARAEYELTALTVREATIRAPFAGEIAERLVTRGNNIAAGETAFRIVAVDALEATLAVPERDIGPLRVGQRAALRADALPDRDFSAAVARIAPVVDGDSGTVAVTVRVEDASDALRAGMFVRARIVHDRRDDVLLVPAEALQRDDGADYVFVADYDDEEQLRARRTRVELGYREGGLVEVRNGIGDGLRVVTSGRAGLRDGARLREIAALTTPDGTLPEAVSDNAAADR